MLDLLREGYVLKISGNGCTPTEFCLIGNKLYYYNREISLKNEFSECTWLNMEQFKKHLQNMKKQRYTFTFTFSR